VNSGFYCDVLRRLRENVQRRRPKLWQEQTWLLHHDKAPSHTTVLTQHFLAKNNMVVIPHSTYSPDLAPCDFFLFPKIKLKLKGRRFDTTDTASVRKLWIPPCILQISMPHVLSGQQFGHYEYKSRLYVREP